MDKEKHRKPRIVVLASGRGSNFQSIIDAGKLGKLNGEIAGLISDNPHAFVLKRADKYGIPKIVVERGAFISDEDFQSGLIGAAKQFCPDLLVLAGFMRLLGKNFLNEFKDRIINIHPSLLPAFRGLNAQKQALEYGVKYTGCTVHFIDEGMDTGSIIDQRVVPVLPGDTEEILASRILREEHVLLVECINAILGGRVKRDGRKVTIIGG
ncbi:MAG: phosphoribosylglycinamide formyltransferase [Firmicutes bacterium]|nr:phosphoribosylglycinamide formyltransferase [Bacillota bacterium]